MTIKNLLNLSIDKQINSLSTLKSTIIDKIEPFCKRLLSQTYGQIYWIGLGKTGLIGQKLSASLASLGLSSHFMHATEALHGDIGRIKKDDIVILLSHSGNGDEVCQLANLLTHRASWVSAITCDESSKLAQHVEDPLCYSVREELCAFGMMPTLSSLMLHSIGNLIMVTIQNLIGFSNEDFGRNHPAGLIGKKLHLTTNDIMHLQPVLPMVPPHIEIELGLYIMTKMQLGCLIFVDRDKKIIGIFTDGDLRRLVLANIDGLNLRQPFYYTKNPITVNRNLYAIDAAQLMLEKKVSQLIVVENDGTVVGLVTAAQIIQHGLMPADTIFRPSSIEIEHLDYG